MAVSAAVLTFAAVEANATHFRYGTMSWTIDPQDSRTATFTFTDAWRTSFIGSLNYNLGDGTFHTTTTNRTTIGTFLDASSASYTLVSSTVTHTFASNSVFNVSGSSCCRISTLQNGNADDNYNLNGVIDLSATNTGDTGSPVAQAPVIVQMPITTAGSTTSFQLPFLDPDSDNVSVSVTPGGGAGSGLTTPLPTAPGGNGAAMTVSATGLLEWDTSGTTAGQKFALQVTVGEDDSASQIPLDFIVEIANAQANQPPFVDGATFNLEVGDVLAHTVTGGDPDSGPSPLTWNLDSITGPETVSNAIFDANTQLLSWDTTGFGTGIYTFFVSNFDGQANGLNTIVVNVAQAQISEPGLAAIFGLGLGGLAYTRRRVKKS